MTPQIHTFSKDVKERLGFYVYLLLDPETSKPFYIGKGKGDRIFHHLKDQNAESEKVQKIEDLTNSQRGHGCRHGSRTHVNELELELCDSSGDEQFHEPEILIRISKLWCYVPQGGSRTGRKTNRQLTFSIPLPKGHARCNAQRAYYLAMGMRTAASFFA